MIPQFNYDYFMGLSFTAVDRQGKLYLIFQINMNIMDLRIL